MTPQQQLEKLLPKIKRELFLERPKTWHILDLVKKYKLPYECCTPLANRLCASRLALKVWATNSAGPYHHIIEVLE